MEVRKSERTLGGSSRYLSTCKSCQKISFCKLADTLRFSYNHAVVELLRLNSDKRIELNFVNVPFAWTSCTYQLNLHTSIDYGDKVQLCPSLQSAAMNESKVIQYVININCIAANIWIWNSKVTFPDDAQSARTEAEQSMQIEECPPPLVESTSIAIASPCGPELRRGSEDPPRRSEIMICCS